MVEARSKPAVVGRSRPAAAHSKPAVAAHSSRAGHKQLVGRRRYALVHAIGARAIPGDAIRHRHHHGPVRER